MSASVVDFTQTNRATVVGLADDDPENIVITDKGGQAALENGEALPEDEPDENPSMGDERLEEIAANNPEATAVEDTEFDVAKLNTDIDEAQEVTKNEVNSAEVYVDSAAIEEMKAGLPTIGEAAKNISSGLEYLKLTDEAQKVVSAMSEGDVTQNIETILNAGCFGTQSSFWNFNWLLGSVAYADVGNCTFTLNGELYSITGDTLEECRDYLIKELSKYDNFLLAYSTKDQVISSLQEDETAWNCYTEVGSCDDVPAAYQTQIEFLLDLQTSITATTQPLVEEIVRLDKLDPNGIYGYLEDGTAITNAQKSQMLKNDVAGTYFVAGLIPTSYTEVGVEVALIGSAKAISFSAKLTKNAPKKGVTTNIEPKIEKQMGKRGWDENSIDETISNPDRTVTTTDTRYNTDGTRKNDPATAYIDSDGSYVVRNDVTGDIVQISDRTDPDWKSPF